MIPKHITFTGIDAKTDIDALQAIQKRWPISEFGVLASYHWWENGARYLNPQIINTLRGRGLNLSLHLCGQAAIDAANGSWDQIDKLVWGNLDIFNRVQLNISNKVEMLERDYCHIPMILGQELIIQQKNVSHTEVFDATTLHWRKPPFPYRGVISMLLDASGGTGKNTPIKILQTEEKIGYAGGFNPRNVSEKLSYLCNNIKSGKFWIDMETGVRTKDVFSLNKVTKVLEVVDFVIACEIAKLKHR